MAKSKKKTAQATAGRRPPWAILGVGAIVLIAAGIALATRLDQDDDQRAKAASAAAAPKAGATATAAPAAAASTSDVLPATKDAKLEPAKPAVPAGPGGRLEVPETTFDAGTVERGAKISHTFELRNVGEHDLTVDAKPG